jgi:peroxiredoxin
MSAVSIDQPAPDFSLQDFNGKPFRLSEQIGQKSVVLVFNRGFT